MSVLCTFPGKIGDILWALPTVREIARQAGEPVDLAIGGKYAGLVALLKLQPYLRLVIPVEGWEEGAHASWEPNMAQIRRLVGSLWWDQVYHLRYPDWPDCPLPAYTYKTATFLAAVPGDKLELSPWITTPPIHQPSRQEIYLGWSDEWFELKLGLTHLLADELANPARSGGPCGFVQRTFRDSRWLIEAPRVVGYTESTIDLKPGGWLETAQALSSCKLYVGCLSSQWVLANALGVPCLVVEPAEARHNPIFWWDGPIEKDGRPRNRLLRGGDGKPTFDARHLVDAVQEELERKR